MRSCGPGLGPSVGEGTEATGGGVGFGADGLQGGSGVVAAPKLKEGCGVPGALESGVNLWMVDADDTSLRGVEGQSTLNSGAGLGCVSH